METCFNYCGDKGFFSSDERKWVTKVRRLKEKYPDEVRIIAEPEENDGCIYVELPKEWLRVQPPVKRNFTDEQKQESADRLRRMRENNLKQAVSVEN